MGIVSCSGKTIVPLGARLVLNLDFVHSLTIPYANAHPARITPPERPPSLEHAFLCRAIALWQREKFNLVAVALADLTLEIVLLYVTAVSFRMQSGQTRR
jgi:hypothetical protein